jgi:thiamine biosynthesis protein ThiS
MTTISVNGEPRSVPTGLSVAALLSELGLDTRKVAVERNEAIVSRSRYNDTLVAEGDSFEIVHFIGGG